MPVTQRYRLSTLRIFISINREGVWLLVLKLFHSVCHEPSMRSRNKYKGQSDLYYMIHMIWFSDLRFTRRTFHEPKLIQIRRKNAHFGQTACKIRYNNLYIRFGSWKFRRLNQSRSKVAPKSKFPAGLGGRTAEPFQTEIGVPNRFGRPTFHVLNLLS